MYLVLDEDGADTCRELDLDTKLLACDGDTKIFRLQPGSNPPVFEEAEVKEGDEEGEFIITWTRV